MPVYELLGGPFDAGGVRGYYRVDGASREQPMQLRETAVAQGVSCVKTGIAAGSASFTGMDAALGLVSAFHDEGFVAEW